MTTTLAQLHKVSDNTQELNKFLTELTLGDLITLMRLQTRVVELMQAHCSQKAHFLSAENQALQVIRKVRK